MTWHGSRGSARCAPTMSPSGGSAGAALPSSILDTTTSCLLHTTAPSSFNPSMIIIVARKHCWECGREHVKLWICICLRLVLDQCRYYYSKYCITWFVIITMFACCFSKAYLTSQQCFSLTTNQYQPAQTSPETDQWTRRINSYLLKFKRWCCLLASHLLQLMWKKREKIPLRSVLFIIVFALRFSFLFFFRQNSEQQMTPCWHLYLFSFLVNSSTLNILLCNCIHWFLFYSFMDGLFYVFQSKVFAEFKTVTVRK